MGHTANQLFNCILFIQNANAVMATCQVWTRLHYTDIGRCRRNRQTLSPYGSFSDCVSMAPPPRRHPCGSGRRRRHPIPTSTPSDVRNKSLGEPASRSVASIPWALIESAPVGIALTDAGGKIVRVSRRLLEGFGYDLGELKGVPLDTLLPPDRQDESDALHARHREDTARSTANDRISVAGQTKNGELIPVEITSSTFDTDEGALTMTWIFDRSRESMLAQRFRVAIEGAPSGLIFVESSGKIVVCNRRILEDFGYTRDELLGKSIDILVPRQLAGRHSEDRKQFTANPQQRAMGQGRDLFGRRKDGSELPVEIGLTPIPGRDGGWTMASVVDITKRKEFEIDLKRQNEELLDFVYSASHDLKAPLSTIRGLLAIAADDLEEGNSPSVAELLTMVDRKAKKLSELVEETLALASSDRAEQPVENLDLIGLINGVCSELDQVAELAQVSVKVDAPKELLIRASPRKLQLILDNLLRNAIKYHHPDREARFASVRVRERRGTIAIEVEDNGLGIPERHHQRVFQMFQRFHPEAAEGSGLGLAMVRKQVLSMGGKIEFASSPAGTVFQLELPRQEAE